MTNHPTAQAAALADCQEFMPLSLVPMADANHDPGEHQVMDADTAYVFQIGGSRERAERIVAALNAGYALSALRQPQPSGAVLREIRFGYTNWEGRNSARRAKPISMRYGKSQWHPRDGWLLLALDLDKNEEREFSMRDMVLVEPADALALTVEAAPVGVAVAVAWRYRDTKSVFTAWKVTDSEPTNDGSYIVEPLGVIAALPAPKAVGDEVSKYGEPAVATAIKAIRNWQSNKMTSFTPSNILYDFGDAILAALEASILRASPDLTTLQSRADGSKT